MPIKYLLELANAADEDRFLEEGYPPNLLKRLPHHPLQTNLPTKEAGLGRASTVRRRVSASATSLCEALPVVLVGLSKTLGESVRRKLPGCR